MDCRRFVVLALSKLVRLSYRSRIASVIPPSFAALLAPNNEVLPLPGPPEDAAADGAADGAANGAPEDERDAESVRAYQLLQMVRMPPTYTKRQLCRNFVGSHLCNKSGSLLIRIACARVLRQLEPH